MGFKIAASPTFWYRVKLEATLESGQHYEGLVDVRFKRMPRSRIVEFSEQMKGQKINADTILQISDDWQGVTDEKDQAMSFSPENVKRLCEAVPRAPMAFLTACINGHAGDKEGSREGN